MFWADKIADEVLRRYRHVVDAGTPLVVRDEKTASGKVHVGSLRSASLHAIVADVLRSRGIAVDFQFEINDFDPMDGIPSHLDEAVYKKYMGVPLCNIPSPEPGFANFAELYGQEYVSVLETIGFGATVYRASELYRGGHMNEVIRKALERRDKVIEIYERVSGSKRDKDWYPLNVICEKCGNLSATRVTDFDGKTVGYTCSSDTIQWAEGCGHQGRISPFDGNAKLPWKLDWAAKFVVKGVHFEGGGKDHYTKGGSREVAEAICREVFDHEPPYGVFNEFFLVGGKKMSSSKGNAATAKEMADMLPAHILRLLLLRTPINRQLDFDPEGDAIPILFDTYDRFAEKYWSGVTDDDTQVFLFAHTPETRSDIPKRFLPRFSQVAFLSQIPSVDIIEEVTAMKGSALTAEDKKELDLRLAYAQKWIDEYAPESYSFAIQENVPEAATRFSNEQKEALRKILEYIRSVPVLDGQEMHTKLHEIREKTGIEAKQMFSALYISLLGKDSGPKAGWFLSVLEKDFLEKRLEAVT